MTKEDVIYYALAEIQKLCINPEVKAEEKIKKIYAAANYATTYFQLDGKYLKYVKRKDDYN